MSVFIDVFNHLVLPPQLLGRQDESIGSTGDAIIARLIQATLTLSRITSQEQTTPWYAISQSLHRYQSLHAHGRLEKLSLICQFRKINQEQPLLLHIAEQNAALIVRYNTSTQTEAVIFEAFEISPSSTEVLASEGALICDFPDCSAQVPLAEFEKPSFQHALAEFLEKGSMEPLRCFQALVTKAQTPIVESRDTGSPGLVTHLLIPLLESIGSSVDDDIPRLRKRVRDDANIGVAEFPWRRSPLWITLRVGIQRQLQITLGNESGRAYYKFLIVTLLIELLLECPGRLAPELTMTLRAKVCRRLAKLEQEKSKSPELYGSLFITTAAFFKESIIKVTHLVNLAWEKFRRDTTRSVPHLPTRADQQSLFLSLPNSGSYLQNVLKLPRAQERTSPSLQLPPLHDTTVEQVEKFTDMYHGLTRLESKIEKQEEPQLIGDRTLESICEKLSEAILGLMNTVGAAYNSDPEQMSIFILSLFRLWVRLDKYMVKISPLLLEYHPVFTPELLDALHIPTAAGMRRLRDIQNYIRNRCERCIYQTTIFSEPKEECFVVKYVSTSSSMQQLHQRILVATEASRQAKVSELERWCSEYDEHCLGISGGICTCTFKRDGERDVRGCTKCWHWRVRNRMRIFAHEDFLPNDAIKAAAVIFELAIPRSFAAYRNATWKILMLAYPTKPQSGSPTVLLKDYGPLTAYASRNSTGITIASTSKSFLGTHYKVSKKKLRASESDVLYPNGLNFSYFDIGSGTWVKDFNKPLTFQHECGVYVPLSLRSSVIQSSLHPPTVTTGPSSYEIVASETQCPPSVSVHEFTACQRLISGKTRRWLTMLVELGASNVNFSSESTMHLFNHLAIQAGPAKNKDDTFGDIHSVFDDMSFCDSLAAQVEKRLSDITSNWREVHCMEVMITLTLRLCDLAVPMIRADNLLVQARHITLDWITRLRADVRNAKETSIGETAASYAFWAALLCRRTFSNITESDTMMSESDLSTFVQASLALQENLLVDLAKLPPVLKRILIRDTKITYKIRKVLLRSIKAQPQSIGIAINASWSEPGSSARKLFDGWQQVSPRHDRWVVSFMNNSKNPANTQVVHYNFIEGHLLVDGKPLGRLPHDVRESDEVRQLFGDQRLLTFPSAEFGMSYVLASPICNHEIHFGSRNGQVVIRAWSQDELLEYIPSHRFVGPEAVDLPDGLISNCAHWLNLSTKCLEIRRKPVLWRTRMNDWRVDLIKWQAHRSNRTLLVDPNSTLFKQVADIFRHFEDSRKITIFQPIHSKGNLSVELRHLELAFFVNTKGLLQCRELNEEIDPNQDAGTLYGLESKIVLRDIANIKRRSIITPYEAISSARRGMHVTVRAACSTDYAKFGIDDVLGRLSCPLEPRILYAKAQFHAYTSFVIPDPLTGRTGTEEALHMLQSAYCQPWQPLGRVAIDILKTIADLSPKREYYPAHKQALQAVSWNARLTVTIQHDAYEGLVQKILDRSNYLEVFAQNAAKDVNISAYVPSHLRKRGLAQRRVYERSVGDTIRPAASDCMYKSRGQQPNSMQARKVYHIANLFQTKPFQINTSRELSAILQDWQLIGGFHTVRRAEVASLSDLVEKNVNEQWGSLVDICRHSDINEPYSLMFRLSLMSLNGTTDLDTIKILAAFASLPTLRNLIPPSCSSFNQFKLNEKPSVKSIFRIISADLPEKRHQINTRAEVEHRKACEAEGKRLAQHFLDQWPHEEVNLRGFDSDELDIGLAMERVIPEWERLHSNLALSEYVIRVQDVLRHHEGPGDMSYSKAWDWAQEQFHGETHDPVIPSILGDILPKSLPGPLDRHACELLLPNDIRISVGATQEIIATKPVKENVELRQILCAFVKASNPLRQQYGLDLKMSLDALEKTSNQTLVQHTSPNITVNARCIRDLRTVIATHLAQIQRALSSNDDRFSWLDLGNLWPCMTSISLLEQLRSRSSSKFGDFVQEAIVAHGILITKLQRLVRIHNALYRGKSNSLSEELGNSGHGNWNPLEWPDWLLLEIDSDILIRQEQVDVAHAIIAPESRNNTVLQLNMGKGKTSCIVPMAMAVIGDGKQLPRLIVPKPLLLPTAQMIQSRLGGLVGREIRHIPFYRRTNISRRTLQLYRDLHQEILDVQGVVLIAPEHLLSYKLSGLQHLASANLETACEMIEFQKYLSSVCRDVLDESDVSLAVKTQLIYPSGKQTTVDGHPHRWQVAQSLLSLVKDHLPELEHKFPRNIEVLQRGQGYPMIYILQADVEEDLHRHIVDEICTGRTSFLRFADCTTDSSIESLRRVLLETSLDHELLGRVAKLFTDDNIAFKTLLLVRGLLRNRILLLCLRKRWNVQYGLHPKRDPIAVPFEAKGIPSEQAEFGHPDAAILFTCLAFYYTGLSRVQFREALRHILASHDPASEYDRWTSSCDSLPEALHHWNVINSDDHDQVGELWRHLRADRTVLDHYMNHFVFPAHAKQFDIKLQASGWDLPLFTRTEFDNPLTGARTTGFSGTNDNKMMLPLTIQQSDLPSLHQTNAEVLTYLLQERNRAYHVVARGEKRLSEREFLEQLREKNIRVLIDAGAYILEMSNENLVKAWMDIDTRPPAAVYFGADNRAWVRYRGIKESVPLLATPFVDNMDNCLVYLDEAHTRGIDLKLPQDACGALTLALGQTKDHTVQAAMRLRQLPTTQSVCFFAFPETHQSILDVCGMNETDRVNSSHVVTWLLEQTCRSNEQLQNLYVSQGADFCNRINAEWENADFLSNAKDRSAYVQVLQHPEQQTLEELYGSHKEHTHVPSSSTTKFTQLQTFKNKLNELRLNMSNTATNLHSSALEEVEQEREVEFQVEEVREVQKALHHKAHVFPGLHPAISGFVSTGRLCGVEGYEHVFDAVSRTSIGKRFDISGTESCLFVSAEFMKTIKTTMVDLIDNHLRPVEWILYNPTTFNALIIIAEEAEMVIPQIRNQAFRSKVHLLTYSAPVTKKMVQFSSLRYYSLPALQSDYIIPRSLTVELGIFAGRLYMQYDECAPLVDYIDKASMNRRSNARTNDTIRFILEWVSLRRRGHDIMHTPLGYVCQGRPLGMEHAFFVTNHASNNGVVNSYHNNGAVTGAQVD
ncbi:hypothetical protein LEMA_P094020.1 [Plenodomus lingam JN3]|uniref:ubiquitinyl hydrolase 1 n=2 Tax=Leptosphaeria maculans TaxID=5022 RepID=E5A2Y0_LEPMJ|nr:hypothetical protein LEMA_P094020.1 [Plenodomus lingam JN3]CBX97993.1 hypothetical protein LEMA_P094020.1 [Plenodomus lingam JN3]